MKKIGKIFGITLLILVVGILLIDMIRVAGCHEPFIKVKTSCDYEDQNNNSVYKVSGIGCEYIEDSNGAENIGGILGKVLGIKVCDIPAGNLTSCRIEESLNDEGYTPIEEWTKILQQSGWDWSNKENVYPTEWLKTLDSGIGNYPYGNFSSKNREELITFESTSEDGLISRYAIYDRENHKWLFDCFEESGGGYIHVDETINIDDIDVMSCKEKYDEVLKGINKNNHSYNEKKIKDDRTHNIHFSKKYKGRGINDYIERQSWNTLFRVKKLDKWYEYSYDIPRGSGKKGHIIISFSSDNYIGTGDIDLKNAEYKLEVNKEKNPYYPYFLISKLGLIGSVDSMKLGEEFEIECRDYGIDNNHLIDLDKKNCNLSKPLKSNTIPFNLNDGIEIEELDDSDGCEKFSGYDNRYIIKKDNIGCWIGVNNTTNVSNIYYR